MYSAEHTQVSAGWSWIRFCWDPKAASCDFQLHQSGVQVHKVRRRSSYSYENYESHLQQFQIWRCENRIQNKNKQEHKQIKSPPYLFEFLHPPQDLIHFQPSMIRRSSRLPQVSTPLWLFMVVSTEWGVFRKVIASQCLCISSVVWKPGLWTKQGPSSSGSVSGAWCRTSWQTCSCMFGAGRNGPGQPIETLGSSGVGVRGDAQKNKQNE